jgi:hypothetical protein
MKLPHPTTRQTADRAAAFLRLGPWWGVETSPYRQSKAKAVRRGKARAAPAPNTPTAQRSQRQQRSPSHFAAASVYHGWELRKGRTPPGAQAGNPRVPQFGAIYEPLCAICPAHFISRPRAPVSRNSDFASAVRNCAVLSTRPMESNAGGFRMLVLVLVLVVSCRSTEYAAFYCLARGIAYHVMPALRM